MSKTELAILLGQEYAKAEREYLDAVNTSDFDDSPDPRRHTGTCNGINRVARAVLGDNRKLWNVFYDAQGAA